jgi:alkylation response protein AidB-like acyl-CoA dehydrogenase
MSASPHGPAMQDKEIFTAEHRQLRETVRKFAKSLAPFAEQWDEEGIFPREVFKQAGDLGLLGIGHSPEYGGMGLDWWYTCAWAEELIHTDSAGVNMALMVQSDMATPIINEIGSDEVKRNFLAPAIKGEMIAALGVSEPGGRQRCGGHPHDGAAGWRRLCDQRPEALDHQRHALRLHHAGGAHGGGGLWRAFRCWSSPPM